MEHSMKIALTALAFGLSLAAPVLAADLTEWGTSGPWVILQDPNHGNACLAQVSLSDGSMLRIGFHDKGKKGFIASVNPAWTFERDKEYPITYMFDTESFEGKARGIEVGGVRGASIAFESVDFLVDLAEKTSVTFISEGVELTKVDLAGSKDALAQMVVCQAEQG
jgi:hypothetical protein